MGCDIHGVVEFRFGDGPWVEAPVKFYDDRNYELFARLAGVRNSSYRPQTPIAEPRGVPEGLSAKAQRQLDYWDVDAHSESWLTLEEAEEARGVSDGFDAMLDQCRALLGEVRLVFWFDN